MCSKDVLYHEISNIKEDLGNNGYPISFFNKYCTQHWNAERAPSYRESQLQYEDDLTYNIKVLRLKNVMKNPKDALIFSER